MRFNVQIQQPPIPCYDQKGVIYDYRSQFLTVRGVVIEADDAEIALCKANLKFPTFKGRLAVNEVKHAASSYH